MLSNTLFWLKVHERGDCWEWRGARAVPSGYGRTPNTRLGFLLAHRVSFEKAKGPLPQGAEVHHTCHHPWCVRPSHLVMTNRREHIHLDNSFMAVKARQTHCVNGHPYDQENTKYNTNGTRYCRECNRIRSNAVYAAKKASRERTP